MVTSLPVTRALAAEIAAWSVRLALFTTWLAGLATPDVSSRLTDQPFVVSARGELASASQWLLAASAALRPAHDADPVRAADADLLEAIPAAVPPARQPLGAAAESIAELCDGITVSASRLRAAVHRGQDRARWSPDVTSGAWQWMAQAAAITSHLSELALRSLAERAGQHPALPVTPARLHGAADAMTGMRTAWQQVDLMWNTLITERRLLSTPAMSEASDLLLRMGRLVWDNPQWTPARACRGPRRDPAALAPGPDAFTAVLAAAHQAADALARVAITDTDTVQAAAQAGRLFVPTRSLPTGFDVPRAYAPALTEHGPGVARRLPGCCRGQHASRAAPGRAGHRGGSAQQGPGTSTVGGTGPRPATGQSRHQARTPRPPRSPAGGRVVQRQPCQYRPARAGRAGHPPAPGPGPGRPPPGRSDRQRGPVLDRPSRHRQPTPQTPRSTNRRPRPRCRAARRRKLPARSGSEPAGQPEPAGQASAAPRSDRAHLRKT